MGGFMDGGGWVGVEGGRDGWTGERMDEWMK